MSQSGREVAAPQTFPPALTPLPVFSVGFGMSTMAMRLNPNGMGLEATLGSGLIPGSLGAHLLSSALNSAPLSTAQPPGPLPTSAVTIQAAPPLAVVSRPAPLSSSRSAGLLDVASSAPAERPSPASSLSRLLPSRPDSPPASLPPPPLLLPPHTPEEAACAAAASASPPPADSPGSPVPFEC